MPKQFKTIFRTNKKNAHVRKNNGIFEIRIQIDGYRITAGAKTLDEAKERFIKKLRQFEGRPKRKTPQKKGHLFLPYVLQWMETVKKPYIKAGTYKMYMQTYNAYVKPFFANRTIESLTQFELQARINEFVNAQKFRTAEKVAMFLSAVLDYAVDDGIIPRSPMKRVIVAKYEEEHGQPLTRAEEATLVSAFRTEPTPYLQAYVFMLYTGLRRGEMESVEISDGWISVITGKQRKGLSPKRRYIPVCPMLAPFLDQIDIEAVKNLSAAMLTKHIKQYLPSHHCHDLRHTFITRAQECGIQRELVSLWAGHAADGSITTRVYTHLEQNKERQIAQMLLFSYDLT